jgi:hypothetical protein
MMQVPDFVVMIDKVQIMLLVKHMKYLHLFGRNCWFYEQFSGIGLGRHLIFPQYEARSSGTTWFSSYHIYKLGHVAQLVDALRHMPECHTFDSQLCHCNFHWQSLRPPCSPGVNWASNRNEYQGTELTLPPSCAKCPEIWEPQPPAALRACPGLYRDSFTCTFYIYPLGLLYKLNSG